MSAARRHRKQVFGLRRRRDLYMLDPQDRASCLLSSTLARCSLSISCFSPHPPAPSFRMAQFVSFSSFVLVLFRSLTVLPVLPVVCPCNPASFALGLPVTCLPVRGPEFPVPALGTPPVSRMEGPRPCPGCAQPT